MWKSRCSPGAALEGLGRAGNEEEPMDPQDKGAAANFPAAGQDVYLPFGGTDPDFYIPADHERKSGGISRWFRMLPVFGSRRP
jgi:hypothetical protein